VAADHELSASSTKWSELIVSSLVSAVIGLPVSAIGGALFGGLITWVTDSRLVYDFENPAALGWNVAPADACPNRGCAFVARRLSDQHAASGHGSLEVEVELRGRTRGWPDAQQDGEISVYIEQAPPAGMESAAPADLFLAQLEATVYVPQDLVSREATRTASFLQLFAHECDPTEPPHYGTPGQIVRSGGPVRLRYRFWSPSTRQICRIGIKMGLNDADPGTYRGRIYIDDVGWTPTAWYWRGFVGTALLFAAGALAFRRWQRRRLGRTGDIPTA
jgi:hypothetical protein